MRPVQRATDSSTAPFGFVPDRFRAVELRSKGRLTVRLAAWTASTTAESEAIIIALRDVVVNELFDLGHDSFGNGLGLVPYQLLHPVGLLGDAEDGEQARSTAATIKLITSFW